MWEYMAPIQQLGACKGWQIVHEIDHCMVTCELDSCYFPMKPTTYVLYNCKLQSDICCFNRCDNRLTSKGCRHLHHMLVCNRSDKHPQQIVLDNKTDKSRIPQGLFRLLDTIRLQSYVPAATSVRSDPPDLPPAQLLSPPVLDASKFHDKIVATSKVSTKDDCINQRVRLVSGLSRDEALQVRVPRAHGPPSLYKAADLRYDVKHGYIEYAALVSLPTFAEETAAIAECRSHVEMCMLTSSGGEPHTRRMAEKSAEYETLVGALSPLLLTAHHC